MAFPSLTCQSVCTLKKQLRTIDVFLCNYDWLMNSYTTDYFTLDLEKKFPSSFSEFLLKDGSLNDLASLLPDWKSDSSQGDNAKAAETTPVSGAVLPLSMIAFRSLCRSLSLNQKLGVVADESLGATVFGGSLEKYFRVCVKAKKKHEVDLLAEMLSILCKSQGCERVVDIGAGLGHLSRLLSYNKNLKVTTVEATDSHSPKAQRLDRRAESLMTKHNVLDGSAVAQPNHISHWIESSITTEEFIKLLTQDTSCEDNSPLPTATSMLSDLSNKMTNMLIDCDSSQSQLSACDAEEPVCLSGLHACGDLSTTIIRVFAGLPCAKVLSSVGCCYMKLSCAQTGSTSKEHSGFPMSDFVRSLPHYRNMCSYESLEMGCHFISQYRQRLLASEPSLKRHVVRAALQILLYKRKRKSEIQFRRLKIKNSEQLPFKEYAERAFKRLGMEYDVTSNEIEECESLIESHWRAVVGAYTVRLALAPLVEAYILIDRVLYLWEHGISSSLVPVFDPRISPRNMAIVAVKS